MTYARQLLFASMTAVLTAGTVSAQPGIPICTVSRFINGFNNLRDQIYHTETFSECNGGTWHNVTYIYTFGNQGTIPYMDVDTGSPCACSANSAPEDNCHSTGTSGQVASYDNSAASVSTNLSSTASPGSSTGAQIRQDAVVPKRAPKATAASPAFTYTLPYRALPAGFLETESVPSVTPACNSALNPTMFEVAHQDATVTRYDLCTKQRLAVIDVPPLPLQVRVTPDGSEAIVTSYGNAITFIDTATNQISSSIQTEASFTPSGVAISPDGTFALVTNYKQPPDAYLAVVNIATQQVTRTLPLDTEYPQSVFITPDGTLAWVTFPWDNLVEVIDLLTGVSVVRLGAEEPYSVAFNPTGTVAYIANGAGSVQVLNTTTYALISTLTAGFGAGDLLASPDEVFVSANNAFGSSLTAIDPISLTATQVPLSGAPRGVVRVPTQ